MKIEKWKNGQMVRLTTEEALKLITSLSQQILNKNPNCDRLELYHEGKYFSVAVLSQLNSSEPS